MAGCSEISFAKGDLGVELLPQAARSLNVLVLDEWLPYPPDSGKRARTWNLLRRLARRHRISLLCYGEPEHEASAMVRSAGIRLHVLPPLADSTGWHLYGRLLLNLFSRYPYSVTKHYTARFRARLQQLLQEEPFDLVHCEWTPYARFLGVVSEIPKLIMAHNIESQIWLRRSQQSKTMVERAFFASQAQKMKWFEREALRRADWVAAVTPLDAAQVRGWGAPDVSLVENGAELDYFAPAGEPPVAHEILCLGSFDWYPNLDAAEYMVDEVFPLILARQPAARLRLVGRRPPSALEKRIAHCPGMELVGEVPDVRPHLARASVVAVPLRIGGGSRIKILEALAMGKAVVSTSIGAEGLVVRDEVHLALADIPLEFAARTAELLNSPEKGRRLGEAGRRLVVESYSWERAAQALEAAWLEAAGARQRTRKGEFRKTEAAVTS